MSVPYYCAGMRKKMPRPRSVAIAVACSLVLAACGSGTSGPTDTTLLLQKNSALGVAEGQTGVTVKSVHGGAYFTVAIDDNGKLYGWGNGTNGQLGFPSLRGGATKFVTATTGGVNHTLALDNLGQVYAWGNNAYGQLNVPTLKPGGTKFVAIGAGQFTSFAIDDAGQLYGWGIAANGQLSLPALRGGATKFVSVVGATIHSLALDNLGQMYAFGSNAYGQMNVPTLRGGATKFVSIAATQVASVALDDLGQFYGFGTNSNGQLNPPSLTGGGTKFVAVAAQNLHTVALDDLGHVYDWGGGSGAPPALKPGATKFVSVTAGLVHSSAADDAGNVYSWGNGNYGQLSIPESFMMKVPRMPIAMGGYQAYGIEDTGTISKFDSGPDGYAPDSAGPFNYIAAGARHALAVTVDGHVVAWGESTAGQLDIPDGLANVVQVAAGYAYSVALRADGRVVEWGSHVGQAKTMVAMPADLPKLAAIRGGLRHVLGITRTGTVVAWGDNRWGQATPPAGLSGVIAVTALWDCSAALKSDGSIVYWGACLKEFTATTNVPGAKSLAMTNQAVIALKSDGSITAWGADAASAVMKVPTGTDFAAISAGYDAAMAVTKTGTVVTWGDNGGHAVTIPVDFGGIAPAEGKVCDECDNDPETYTPTDAEIDQIAANWYALLTQDQRDRFIKALGGTPGKALSPSEIDALVKSASTEQKAAATSVVATSQAQSPVDNKAAVLPTSQDPVTKVGTVVTTAQAVGILRLGKVSKVSFIVPKKAAASCTVTKSRVTASSAGMCTVTVRYTKAKKAKKAVLTLLVG